jgi:hypothetical protein
MFPFSTADRQNTARRQRTGRRLLVEDLEGRRLLSGIQGNHIGSVAAIASRQVAGSSIEPVGTSGLRVGANTVRFFEYNSATQDARSIALPSPMQNENRQFSM